MKCFKALFNFYLNASFHVALAAVSLVFVTAKEFNVDVSYYLVFFISFCTILGYNFVKFYGIYKSHFSNFVGKLLLIKICTFLGFLGVVYCAFFLRINTLIITLILAFITLFYAIPFAPKRFFNFSVSNLRMIAGIKVYLIALVWVGVTVVLPLVEGDIMWQNNFVITAAQRFFIIVTLMLPFEIRDLQFDSLKLETIPQKIGVKTTKVLGFILIALVAILEFIKGNEPSDYTIGLLLLLCLTALFLRFASTEQSKYYTTFWVDAIPLIWILLLILL